MVHVSRFVQEIILLPRSLQVVRSFKDNFWTPFRPRYFREEVVLIDDTRLVQSVVHRAEIRVSGGVGFWM